MTDSASNPTGAGFSLGQFVGKLFSNHGGPGMVGGVSPMGDFDPIAFVNANLSAAQHAKGGLGLKDVTQGIGQLLGIGKNHVAGAPADETEAAGTPEEPDDGAPMNPNVGAIHPKHVKHAQDLLANIISTLSSDPNTGAQ